MTKRLRRSALNNWATFLILIAVSACGGGGQGGTLPPENLASTSTLAYVVTDCRIDAQGETIRQRLQIRRGGQDPIPITVADTSAIAVTNALPCEISVGIRRAAFTLIWLGVFHRLGVSPDGSQVVFEVTDNDVQRTLFPQNAVPTELKGIFAVRADGTDLRRLSDASREPPYNANIDIFPNFAFSPNGRTIVYTDRGPSRDNQDAVQVFTLDLVTAKRRQVTQLPPARQSATAPFGAWRPFFNDDRTITFLTSADPDGTNPDGENIVVTVDTDTNKLTVSPGAIAIPGSTVQTGDFQITGSKVSTFLLRLPGTPVNDPSGTNIQEVFVIDGVNGNVLQLTNFRRNDTWIPTLSADGQRVLFSAAPNLPTNPSEACQVFSTDRNGGDLHQLTDFHEGPHSIGCNSGNPPLGCFVYFLSRDTQTNAIVFDSSCDPFGTNPYGSQVFAMHADGTDLRQLTKTQGFTTDADGVVTVEHAFPFAHPGKLQ